MKNKYFLFPICFFVTLCMVSERLQAQELPAIVTTIWLAENIDTPDLVILDARSSESYAAGHIPGSINLPAYPNWYINEAMGGKLPWMELPNINDLYTTIGNAGISYHTNVIVVGRASDSPTEGPAYYSLTKTARVAITLIYAGIKNVAILNGGYDKWELEGRLISTEATLPKAIPYSGKAHETIFVSKDYVKNKLGKSIIIDTRDSDTYFGIEHDFSSKKAGHIPTAKVLPAPWFWEEIKVQNKDKTCLIWKDPVEIKEIAITVLGDNLDAEIIDYCGVGGYASPVWFLLTKVVGYSNVKFYDGSMQEWTSDPDAAVTKYKYE